jgi:butyrate kinase
MEVATRRQSLNGDTSMAATRKYILTINPGSTSTKIGIYEGQKALVVKKFAHSAEELSPFQYITDQYELRTQLVVEALKENKIAPEELKAVVGRGGLLKPIPSGVYEVNGTMLDELRKKSTQQHASNLGALMADAIAQLGGCKAYIVDPVVVDELSDIARISGNPHLPRISIFHALNHKRIARQAAAVLGRPYEALSLIVAHMGGGISVGLHVHGRVVDVNNALDGDGAFSPERSGGVPCGQLVDRCFDSGLSKSEIKKQIAGKGGFVAYLGTNDAMEVVRRIEQGDQKARLIWDAMIYQIGKDIGAMAAAASGKVDAIVLTGGLANEKALTVAIEQRVGFIAPVQVFGGEDELGALCDGVLRVLLGEEQARTYV